MQEIFNRRSIRRYTRERVSPEMVEKLLQAAMAAPSAGNEQPWEFILLRDTAVREQITAFHPYAGMLPEADVAIVVCGDTRREKYPGFWVQDCAAATQNILLQAEALGLGAVWLGVYPLAKRVKPLQELLHLPDTVIPLAIIPIGYPGEAKAPAQRFDPSRIHDEVWDSQ